MATLNGSFQVASWDESPYDEREGRRARGAHRTRPVRGSLRLPGEL